MSNQFTCAYRANASSKASGEGQGRSHVFWNKPRVLPGPLNRTIVVVCFCVTILRQTRGSWTTVIQPWLPAPGTAHLAGDSASPSVNSLFFREHREATSNTGSAHPAQQRRTRQLHAQKCTPTPSAAKGAEQCCLQTRVHPKLRE